VDRGGPAGREPALLLPLPTRSALDQGPGARGPLPSERPRPRRRQAAVRHGAGRRRRGPELARARGARRRPARGAERRRVRGGLPLPHSPRVYVSTLYALLSATGDVIAVDVQVRESRRRVGPHAREAGQHRSVAGSERAGHSIGSRRVADASARPERPPPRRRLPRASSCAAGRAQARRPEPRRRSTPRAPYPRRSRAPRAAACRSPGRGCCRSA
jgi:hypothetical protein